MAQEFDSRYDGASLDQITSEAMLNGSITAIFATGSLLESLVDPSFVDLVQENYESALMVVRRENSVAEDTRRIVNEEAEALISRLKTEIERLENQAQLHREESKEMRLEMADFQVQLEKLQEEVRRECGLTEELRAELEKERDEREADNKAFVSAIEHNVS